MHLVKLLLHDKLLTVVTNDDQDKSASASETLEGKAAFEAFSKDRGASVQAHHADNGTFKAKAWVQHCYKSGQDITFSGVGAHHQNGMAER